MRDQIFNDLNEKYRKPFSGKLDGKPDRKTPNHSNNLKSSLLIPPPFREFSAKDKKVRSHIRTEKYKEYKKKYAEIPITVQHSYRDSNKGKFRGNIQYLVGDMISFAADIDLSKGTHTKTCILNMANNRKPGGGYLNGANAQEEQLCSRTIGLFDSLKNAEYTSLYPINKRMPSKSVLKREVIPKYYNKALITENVKISRDGNLNEYRYSNTVDVISIASVNLNDYPKYKRLQSKILESVWKTILNVASSKKYTNLVISAIGAGAFLNDPFICGQTLGRALETQGDCIENIYVVVMDDLNSKDNSVNMLKGLNTTLNIPVNKKLTDNYYINVDIDSIKLNLLKAIEIINSKRIKKYMPKIELKKIVSASPEHDGKDPVFNNEQKKIIKQLQELNQYTFKKNSTLYYLDK